jgi:hypothetical protein
MGCGRAERQHGGIDGDHEEKMEQDCGLVEPK